jgi:hypothetical protein
MEMEIESWRSAPEPAEWVAFFNKHHVPRSAQP